MRNPLYTETRVLILLALGILGSEKHLNQPQPLAIGLKLVEASLLHSADSAQLVEAGFTFFQAEQPLGLQVYTQYLLWGLKYITI